ncbi:PAS domain-containing protein [Falsirhodobacter sp. 1013]|uniref:PAS domain-containing protein n=1 Tax=Falsirhodobacter sp. 1013 TaxID=3417566 RepID=UPI003EB991D1
MRNTILVVEDAALIAMDLVMALEEAGYVVVGVAATKAAALADAHSVYLATIDVELAQGANGIDTAIELRTRYDISSIFVGGSLTDETIRQAAAADPIGCLGQASRCGKVLHAVERYLSRNVPASWPCQKTTAGALARQRAELAPSRIPPLRRRDDAATSRDARAPLPNIDLARAVRAVMTVALSAMSRKIVRGCQEPALQGGGECGRLLRALDWENNPLGPPSEWPQELITVMGIAMASAQPVLIVWGPEQITLYNDGYAQMCGNRHPAALGRPFRELWFDIWNQVEPIITAAYRGTSTSMDDIEFTMHRKGYPEETHFAFSYNPVRDRAGKVVGMFCPCTEITAAVALRDAQRVERSGFLQVIEVALGAVALLSGPDHVFRYVNEDYQALIGKREIVGLSVRDALPEVIDQGFLDLLDRVYRSGEPHVGRNVKIDLQRRADKPVETRLLDFLYHPVRDDDGSVTGIFVQALDVTEQVEAQHQQVLLSRELGHRMKNQLALVQAIVNQTLRSAPDLPSAMTSVSARLRVLATAHDRLIEGRASAAAISDIVRDALALYDQARMRAKGPEVIVAGPAALSLSLMLHELATNAVKYGALSETSGVVRVTWETEKRSEGGSRFVLCWTEEGGPAVSEPSHTGSGTRLIKAGLAGGRDGEVQVMYAPAGLRCRIAAELSSLQSE